MKLTAATITDQQIRELRETLSPSLQRKQRGHRLMIIAVALGERRRIGWTRKIARARCAEILNAWRAK